MGLPPYGNWGVGHVVVRLESCRYCVPRNRCHCVSGLLTAGDFRTTIQAHDVTFVTRGDLLQWQQGIIPVVLTEQRLDLFVVVADLATALGASTERKNTRLNS